MKKALLIAGLLLAAGPASADAPGVGGLALMPVFTYPHEHGRCVYHNPPSLFRSGSVHVRDRVGKQLREKAGSVRAAVEICLRYRDYMGLRPSS